MFSNNMVLQSIHVSQGNGNGRWIRRMPGSKQLLETSDLIDCIAILITDDESCYLIHSDANDNSGIGQISLKQGLEKLGIKKDNVYNIGLIGGQTQNACDHKQKIVQNLLPNSVVSILQTPGRGDTAYLTGDGFMTGFKRDLKLKVNSSSMTDPGSSPTSQNRR